MFEAIKSFFEAIFTNKENSNLENYITSHNPQNANDVEYLTRQYDVLNRARNSLVQYY